MSFLNQSIYYLRIILNFIVLVKNFHNSHSENPQLNFISDNTTLLLYNSSRNHEQINLGSKVSLKYLHQILETQEKHEALLDSVIKNQKLVLNKLNQVSFEVSGHKPLTAKQVTNLVEQIAQQPKLVEAEALRLTANLEDHVQEVKKLAHEIKGYLLS